MKNRADRVIPRHESLFLFSRGLQPRPFCRVHITLQTSSLLASLASSPAATLVQIPNSLSLSRSSVSGGSHMFFPQPQMPFSYPRLQTGFHCGCELRRHLSYLPLHLNRDAAAGMHQGLNEGSSLISLLSNLLGQVRADRVGSLVPAQPKYSRGPLPALGPAPGRPFQPRPAVALLSFTGRA